MKELNLNRIHLSRAVWHRIFEIIEKQGDNIV